MNIRFSYKGKNYKVGMEAYELDKILLPDGTMLAVENGWLESLPPQPSGLVKQAYQSAPNTPLESIARQFRCAIATEVK